MSGKQIKAKDILTTVENLVIEANTVLSEDVVQCLQESLKNEDSSIGQDILRQLLENAAIAKKEKLPLCQDTGIVVVFLEIGQEVCVVEGNLVSAVNEAVRSGYKKVKFRPSSVDPLTRMNLGDNASVIIHTEMV